MSWMSVSSFLLEISPQVFKGVSSTLHEGALPVCILQEVLWAGVRRPCHSTTSLQITLQLLSATTAKDVLVSSYRQQSPLLCTPHRTGQADRTGRNRSQMDSTLLAQFLECLRHMIYTLRALQLRL